MRPETQAMLCRMRDNEATDSQIYRLLSKQTNSLHNKKILEQMAQDEDNHSKIWNKYIGGSPSISSVRVWIFTLLGKIFGLVFVINLLESREIAAIEAYQSISDEIPEAKDIMADEEKHESQFAVLIESEGLTYISSMVLGLNDALVELTGALAGFTFALHDNKVISMAGFITGVSATLSMAASEYLARRSEKTNKHPLKAAVYTGVTYLITVALLLVPFIIYSSPIIALIFCLITAGLIILCFTYVVSVIHRKPFLPSFQEMIIISFGVAGVSFVIGWLARVWFDVAL